MLSLIICCIIEFVWIILLEKRVKALSTSLNSEDKTNE